MKNHAFIEENGCHLSHRGWTKPNQIDFFYIDTNETKKCHDALTIDMLYWDLGKKKKKVWVCMNTLKKIVFRTNCTISWWERWGEL